MGNVESFLVRSRSQRMKEVNGASGELEKSLYICTVSSVSMFPQKCKLKIRILVIQSSFGQT